MSKKIEKPHWVIYYSEEGIGPQVKMYEVHAKGANLARGTVLTSVDGSYAEAKKKCAELREKYTPKWITHHVRKEKVE